jgi:hypothetical protein
MTVAIPSLKTPGMTMPAPVQAAPSGGGFLDTAFHDLIDVINPLQHLPVVGTLYRAITGEHIGTVEKIAGDALYGGLWGAVSSVADAAFEAVTGKDFGSAVLALLTGDHDTKPAPVAVAMATPAPAPIQAAATGDVDALSRAMAAKGVDSDLANRALDAYRKATMVAVGS